MFRVISKVHVVESNLKLRDISLGLKQSVIYGYMNSEINIKKLPFNKLSFFLLKTNLPISKEEIDIKWLKTQ